MIETRTMRIALSMDDGVVVPTHTGRGQWSITGPKGQLALDIRRIDSDPNPATLRINVEFATGGGLLGREVTLDPGETHLDYTTIDRDCLVEIVLSFHTSAEGGMTRLAATLADLLGINPEAERRTHVVQIIYTVAKG